MNKVTLASALTAAVGITMFAVTPATAAVVPSDTIALLAVGERDSVFAATTDNNTTTHNGSEWYFSDGSSMGFALEGETVALYSADVEGGDAAWSRLSWHIHGDTGATYVGDGYRLGTNTNLNEGGEFSLTTGRFVFTADTLPSYYPVGPQEDVAIADIDGWTLCWSNTYDDDSLELGSTEDMFAACDGEYILIGAGEMVDGDFADFDGSGDDSASSNGLADTGFDSSALAGFAAALVSLGTVSVLRRRRRS
ncbi:MAG: hypothetical protein RJA31_918 [Actinomycetota bacterium]